jgi:hypothetical protein
VDQELLLHNEYLAAENRILMTKLNGRPRFSDVERATLGEIGFRLGRRALSEVATAAQPDTILAWYRRLVARKFDGSSATAPLPLPARCPNLNAHAERGARSVNAECLSKTIPFGERPLRRAMNDYLAHYHTERNHQGKNNVLLFRQITETRGDKPVRCRDRLGGLLRYYHRAAA